MTFRRLVRRGVPALVAVVALAVGASACGSEGGGDDGLPEATSPAGERGRDLVMRSGCIGCHSVDGSSRSGPTWKGLAGSQTTLDDGTTVAVDAAYLTTAIVDPKAQGPVGYPRIMPDYLQLSEQDVADIVAYIQELPAE